VSILVNIFAPRNAAEFGRLLKQDGLLLIVIPAADHLCEIRSQFDLLQIEAEKERRVVEQMANAFTFAKTHALTWQMNLSSKALLDLIRMTPNAWHLSEREWQLIAASDQSSTTAAFEVLQFCKNL
jgi:23S rRNA (guanine745-N1)-methyltransferase